MTVTTDPTARTVTLTLEINEWNVLEEILNRQPQGIHNLFVDWLKNIRQTFIEQDRQLITKRIETIPAAQIKQIKNLLGL